MVFRLEDTDQERSKKEYEEDIVESLSWLGISYDDGPHRQSERTDIYKEYVQKMIESGHAYVAEESESGEGNVIRFKNPNTTITFNDVVRGEIQFDTTDLGDFVIARNENLPIYHLTVVVDDFLMGVTHVIRGEDGISNTPRQILIAEAIGAQRPTYAHIPLILAPDKSKLSGRHGAVSVRQYKEMGVLPEALINYLALLGWNPGTEQEIFSRDELIKAFDLEKVQKGGAVFSQEKLEWVNNKHIELMDDASFLTHAKSFIPEEIMSLSQYSEERLTRMIPSLKERITLFKNMEDMANAGELEYFFERPGYNTDSLMWKNEDSKEKTIAHLKHAQKVLEDLEEYTNKDDVKSALWDYADKEGRGNVLWPLRYALSGQDRSPNPFELISILGTTESIARIAVAIDKLSQE